MPDFADPFPGPASALSRDELIRALRLGIASEQEAITLYTAQAQAAADPLARKVLLSIADEERVHAGELQALIGMLDPEENKLLEEGKREVDDLALSLRHHTTRQARGASNAPDHRNQSTEGAGGD